MDTFYANPIEQSIGKIPGPSKILVNFQTNGTNSSCFPSWAGKRKSSPPKKSTRANPQKMTTCGNPTRDENPTSTQTNTNSSQEVIVIPESSQKLSGSSSSSSLLNLNSWDGLFETSRMFQITMPHLTRNLTIT